MDIVTAWSIAADRLSCHDRNATVTYAMEIPGPVGTTLEVTRTCTVGEFCLFRAGQTLSEVGYVLLRVGIVSPVYPMACDADAVS